MTLITIDTYRYHTRDLATASAAATGALADAQQLVERELDRPLEYAAEVTETLTPYRDEWGALCVMPRRAPVHSCTDGVVRGGVEIVGPESFGVFTSLTYWRDSDRYTPPPLTVTFEGGWRARGEADHVLPVDLERAICFVAQGLLRESALVGVTGTSNVTSAAVGDVQVAFDSSGEGLDRYAANVTPVLTGYRYRG